MSKQQSGNYEEMPVTGLVVVEEREDLRDPCLRLLVPELRRDGVQELLEVDVALACRRLFLSQDVESAASEGSVGDPFSWIPNATATK